MIEERLSLAQSRIDEIRNELKEQNNQKNTEEKKGLMEYQAYFSRVADFLWQCIEALERTENRKSFSAEFLQEENDKLYGDVLKEAYENSFANPQVAVAAFGEEMGRLLCVLYAELRSVIPLLFERETEAMLIRLELFLEVYAYFTCAVSEEFSSPKESEVKDIIYWYISDYSDLETERKIGNQLNAKHDFARRIVMESDLQDTRYLYFYGERVTSVELETAAYMNSLPDEIIDRMASTFVGGFKRGFEVARKDISKKKTVNIRYRLGFERVVRRSVELFEELGLAAVLYRANTDIFAGKGVRIGYYGAIDNPQYEYDHKDDLSLFLDGHLVTRRLECLTAAYEMYKAEAAELAGPACMEVFGEEIYQPAAKPENPRYDAEGQKLVVEYTSRRGEIVNTYIRREERSFTIIAFPVPAIGARFSEIFDGIIRVNTLDATLYEKMQQVLIDTLDRAECCRIKGSGGNRTDLKVALVSLTDSEKETKFENCVADVNIPVGEVFTSPMLKGTEGILHVSKVFLNEYEYRDLEFTIKDGVITDYNCGNFQETEENRRFIEDNILFHHPTLPMGEFAIGTNTTAYVMAKKYGIEENLPILIAEKMGPHFAFGDTCYSHEEEVRVYNPNGKEIVAKENDYSRLRATDRKKAYFNCHTDITIPYDELALLEAVLPDGTGIEIIRDGRFVLEGCEALNKPFEEDLK